MDRTPKTTGRRARDTALVLLPAAALAALLAVWIAGERAAAPSAAAQEPPAPVADASGPYTRSAPVDPWAKPAAPHRPALFYDRFETLTTADGLPSDRVTCVLAEGGELVVGTEHGLAVRRGGRFTVYGTGQGLAHDYVTSVTRDPKRGDLWVSTLGGLSRVSGGQVTNWTQTNSGLMNDVVYHVLVEGDTVWAGTAAGLSGLDLVSGSWQLHDHTNSIMHEPWNYALATGPGRLWVGLWGGGVVELDRTTGKWREYRDPDGEMEIDLLADDGPVHEVSSFVAFDQGVLWQSTYFGLSRYDGRRWSSYVAADTGFPSDFVSHASSRGHTVWLGTDQGLAVFDGETMVSYVRTEAGTADVRVWRGGQEVERRELPTAPAHNYILWAQGGDDDVWLATGAGLSRGTTDERR
jgi:ligand-binding sensor domain-containing protein